MCAHIIYDVCGACRGDGHDGVLKKFLALMLIMGLTVGARDVGKMENTAGGPVETTRFTATRWLRFTALLAVNVTVPP